MDLRRLEDSIELLNKNTSDNNEKDLITLEDFYINLAGKSPERKKILNNTITNNNIDNNNYIVDDDDDDDSKYQDASLCYRANKFIIKNWYFNLLLPIAIILALIIVIYFCREYAKILLYWIERQNSWLIFTVFMLLFTIVSFPIVIGYLVLIITSGYIFGLLKGILTVILCANLGVAIAHQTIKSLHRKIPFHRLIKNDTGRAILRVISGPRAFKVVMFTRLTPIPFGIQNTIFGISSINPRTYHTATIIGLLPAQAINVYLGSTLRSMHDVLNDHNTALTGYIIFIFQVMIGICLMMWVVHKAKNELSEALLLDVGTEHKIIDIEV